MPYRRQVVSLLLILVAASPGKLCAQDDPEKPQEQKREFKRRDNASDEDLRKQLQFVQAMGFDQAAASVLHTSLTKITQKASAVIQPDVGPLFYSQLANQAKRPDWLALPWHTGQDSQLGKETAEKLHVFSGNLRLSMRKSVPANDVRPDSTELRRLLEKGEKAIAWNKAECVPTLAQMLQTENTSIRLLLIDFLAGIEGKEASVTLAQRAVFDLSPDVREKAIERLANRPVKEYKQTLLDCMRWPWAPAADHAAEALIALRAKDVVPDLISLLKEPDPKLPFVANKVTYVREVVRINHLSNCLLCHAASSSKDDLVRGRIPTPGKELPPLYYAATDGLFVRADTTFLRQDFSLIQPVANSGKWPGFQRFDYLVRTRRATATEAKFLQGLQKKNKLEDPYPQRDSVLFALREITQTDRGSRYESWMPLLNPIEKK